MPISKCLVTRSLDKEEKLLFNDLKPVPIIGNKILDEILKHRISVGLSFIIIANSNRYFIKVLSITNNKAYLQQFYMHFDYTLGLVPVYHRGVVLCK
jgi:hypothetical protein